MKRKKPTLTKINDAGSVTCYRPRKQKPALTKIKDSGSVTCYRSKKA